MIICQFTPSSDATIREVPAENSAVLEKMTDVPSHVADITGKLPSAGKL